MIDGLVFLSYLFEVDQTVYYGITILLKAFLLFARNSGLTSASRSSFAFLFSLAIIEIVSAVSNDVAILSSIRVIVFCVNLVVTLNFVGKYYWRGLVLVSATDAIIYLTMLETGRITEIYGRYLFFANSHPNLGSEIFFGAAYACLLSSMPRLSLALVALFFVPTFFMQGRAAELGILCVAGILAWNYAREMRPAGRTILFFSIIGIGLVIAFNVDLAAAIDKVLLLDDENRGGSTNASGRTLYWTAALAAWSGNPILGAGSDYPTRLGMLQPHNFFLYPLACYGLLGVIVLIIFLRKFSELAFYGRFVYLLPLVPMLAFNDRFVNLNIYPTIMFLFIFFEWDKLDLYRRRARTLSVAGPRRDISSASP
ncbi:hypothetical protein XI00_04930 [Bradyrhizobium sp. CCBAU 21359]|uniref:O-antigen ligase family protein n=1 Tax=Bradyrhizobium sp. CCBAU 21359 TaxID=1325080 RepID=UPI002304E421|nr:O-antigen ligase family protein [Bradyrhizobium sp. CCBAU 21359]MDA9453638.1 hypothetical protein [Bradyrhizobium sp. CCBAU 21359]